MKKPLTNIQKYYYPKVLRIGQHEAGHYIATRALGFKAGSITLTITDHDGGHNADAEITLAFSLSGDKDIVDYLEKRVTILFSGALAESLQKGKLDNDYALDCVRTGGGKNDFAKARELMQLIRNITFPNSTTEEEIQSDLDTICNTLWNRAGELVKQDHEIIEGIGSRLAGDTKYINKTTVLSSAELELLPEIQARFPRVN